MGWHALGRARRLNWLNGLTRETARVMMRSGTKRADANLHKIASRVWQGVLRRPDGWCGTAEGELKVGVDVYSASAFGAPLLGRQRLT